MDETRAAVGTAATGDDGGRRSPRRAAAMVVEQLAAPRDPRSARAGGDGPRCRATASSTPALADDGLRRSAAADRPRPDDLAAVHGGARDRAGGVRSRRDRALEVGAGCGYQAAVLARAVRPRSSPSRSSPRWPSARAAVLAETRLRQRDASSRSTAAAAGRSTRPTTSSSSRRARRASRRCWSTELADGGRLVIPVGRRRGADAGARPPRRRRVTTPSYDTRCRYVDLLGRFGVGGGAPAA